MFGATEARERDPLRPLAPGCELDAIRALEAAGATLPMVILAGANSAGLLADARRATRRPENEAQTGIVVLDPGARSEHGAPGRETLAMDEARVTRFVGDGAEAEFVAWLGARRRLVNRAAILCGDTALRRRVSLALDEAGDQQRAETVRLRARVRAAYARRGLSWWAERYANPGARPLRALIPSSRRTTFVRHSSHDIARALERLGWDAHVLEEPDDWSRLGPLALLDAMAEREPDLVLAINTTHASLAPDVPANTPYLCWVQDDLERLRSREAGAALGPLDFLFGLLRDELFEEFGHPRSRARRAPAPVSPEKFHAGPVGDRLRREHGCEVAYVGHQSAGPDEFHSAFLRRVPPGSGVARALDSLRASVVRIARESKERRALPAIEGATRGALRDALGAEPTTGLLRTIVSDYAMPLADRALRHESLEWASEVCAARGWRLHLYGAGWERHPTLAPLARGALEHGEALRASYQGARAHLHVSVHTLAHQRVFECALSGGLPLCRLHADELYRLELAVVASTLARAGIAPERAPASLSIADHALLAGFAGLCQRTGAVFPTDDRGGFTLSGETIERIRRGDAPEMEHVSGFLLGDLARTTFWTRDGLEALLARAVEDDEWRDASSAMIAGRVRHWVTTDRAVSQALDLVRSSLARTRGGGA